MDGWSRFERFRYNESCTEELKKNSTYQKRSSVMLTYMSSTTQFSTVNSSHTSHLAASHFSFLFLSPRSSLLPFSIETVEDMIKMGVYVNDLNLHDSSRELILAGTQQSAELQLALDQVNPQPPGREHRARMGAGVHPGGCFRCFVEKIFFILPNKRFQWCAESIKIKKAVGSLYNTSDQVSPGEKLCSPTDSTLYTHFSHAGEM